MKDKEIIKIAYRKIVKEKQSHQKAFDSIMKEEDAAPDKVAKLISVIPSFFKQTQFSTLRYLYVGLLLLIFGLRVFAVIEFALYTDTGIAIILLGSVFSIIAPGLGIYAALIAKERFYRSAGILFGLGIFRSLREGFSEFNTEMIFGYSITILAVVLSFYLPYKLKTTYVVENKGTDGKIIYVFEKDSKNFDDLLDSDMI